MAENVVSISHDPFARGGLVRRTLPLTDRQDCAWCGRPGKFEYGWHADDKAHPSWAAGEHLFCSVGCYRSYFEY